MQYKKKPEYAQRNTNFFSVKARRANGTVVSSDRSNVECEFEDIDVEFLVDSILRNITPKTFAMAHRNYVELESLYAYVCAVKNYLEETYEMEELVYSENGQ